MSTRHLLARLDKLPRPAGKGPTCRWHGQVCQMGRSWPLPFESAPDDELLELIEAARRKRGDAPRPTRRERWAHQDHELVPQSELDQQAREAAELLARLKARNERIEAAWAAGDLDYWEP